MTNSNKRLVISKSKYIYLNKQHDKVKRRGASLSSLGREILSTKGMTESQLRGQMISERRSKAKVYESRQLLTEWERELQQLEYKRVRYKSEFKRKMMILQIQESDFIET